MNRWKILGVLAGLWAVSATPLPGMETEALLAAINDARSSAGLQPLQAHPSLTALAQEWALVAAERRSLAHRRDLPKIRNRLGWSVLNENVYLGEGAVDAARVLRAWKNSSGHWRNLMNPQLTHAGLGTAPSRDGQTAVVFNGGARSPVP